MAEKTFNKRLMDAIAEMKDPVRNTKGYNYKYATLDQVKSIVRPALQKNGLEYRQQIKDGEAGSVLQTYIFDEKEDHLMDERQVYIYEDCQKYGSQQTYQSRYALLLVFGLAPEDDDGQATTKAKSTTAKPTPSKAPKQVTAEDETRTVAIDKLKGVLAGGTKKSGVISWLNTSFKEFKELNVEEDKFAPSSLSVLKAEQLNKFIDYLDGLAKDQKELKEGESDGR